MLTEAEISNRIQTVTAETFRTLVVEGSGPIAFEFMSYGCGHCRALEPVLQSVAEKSGLANRYTASTSPSSKISQCHDRLDAAVRTREKLTLQAQLKPILLFYGECAKLGGDAVAEVFRNLPSTKWFCPSFDLSNFGIRPFQVVLDLGYTVLADVRPLLGFESCDTSAAWVKPIYRTI